MEKTLSKFPVKEAYIPEAADNKTPNNRIEWIDAAKGIAIILVVINHTHNPNPFLAKIISSFHLPLFFMISGYLFNFEKYKDNFVALVKNRFSRLLIPYFIWSCIYCAIIILFSRPSFLKVVNILFMSILYGAGTNPGAHLPHNIVPIGSLWFLPCLFCSEIIFWFLLVSTINLKNSYKILFFGLFAYIGAFIGAKIFFLPWSLDIALLVPIFLFCGYKTKQNNLFTINNNWKFAILLLIIWIIDILQGGISINNREYNNLLFSVSGALAASVLIMKLIYFLSIRYKGFCKIFSYIGAQSILILCVHILIRDSIFEIPSLKLYWPVETILIIVLSLLTGIIIKKIPRLNMLLCGK